MGVKVYKMIYKTFWCFLSWQMFSGVQSTQAHGKYFMQYILALHVFDRQLNMPKLAPCEHYLLYGMHYKKV